MSEILHVLIVEDTPADAELMVRELYRAGFHPEWRRVDTESEYRACLHSGLDVVLSDYALPEFSGPRALELLQEQDLEVPFIILSGTIGEDVAVDIMRRGAADYLIKDRLARLGPAIRQAMMQSRLHRMRAVTENALRESEERLKIALSSSRMGVWEWEVESDAIFWSSECYEILGVDSFGGTRADFTRMVHREDVERVATLLKTALEDKTDYAAEFRITRPSGEVRWLSNLGRARYDGAGKPQRMFGTTQDVTDRRQLEEQYRQSQKMEAIGILASGVAHDFNNLLTVIQGNASILLMQQMDRSRLEMHVDEILHAADRAAGLTRQLLLFSRKQVMQPANIDLNEVAGNTTRMLQRILGEDIALHADYAPKLPPIHADEGMIEQILLNLAVNSRDAMPAGGTLTISTSAQKLDELQARQLRDVEPGSYVCLSVRDTGCGIKPEILSRIFEPFFTTKEVGKGTGLGLSTVYGIVRQHHGAITIASEPGQGTTFRIFFPAVTHGTLPESKAVARPLIATGHECILLVEDEPALEMIAARVLESGGYTVLRAENGVAALKVWNEHRDDIHLLMTDMVMPRGISGRELAKRLTTEKPGLKVIYTSGYSPDLAGKGMLLQEGINFLQKPWDMHSLIRVVRECLDRD